MEEEADVSDEEVGSEECDEDRDGADMEGFVTGDATPSLAGSSLPDGASPVDMMAIYHRSLITPPSEALPRRGGLCIGDLVRRRPQQAGHRGMRGAAGSRKANAACLYSQSDFGNSQDVDGIVLDSGSGNEGAAQRFFQPDNSDSGSDLRGFVVEDSDDEIEDASETESHEDECRVCGSSGGCQKTGQLANILLTCAAGRF